MSDNILIINFDAKTKDGLIAQNMKYKPVMSNEVVYQKFPNILFVPTLKIKKSDFPSMSDDDIKNVFLSPNQFNELILRLKKKQSRPITLSEAEARQITSNNIKFILNLFFAKNNKFFLNRNPYIINSYSWNKQWAEKTVPGRSIPQYVIKIKLILHPGATLNFIDSSKLTCMERRNNIVNDFLLLTGRPPRVDKKKPSKKTPPLVPPYPGTYKPPLKYRYSKYGPSSYTYAPTYAPSQTYAPQTYAPTDARAVHLYAPSAPPMPPGGFAPPPRGLPPPPRAGGRKTQKKALYRKRRKTKRTR